MPVTVYCVKCRKSVMISSPETAKITGPKGVRKFVKGKCPTCGSTATRILPNKDTR